MSIFRYQTYKFSRILHEYHLFCSVITHSRISFQILSIFTISSSYSSITHAIILHQIYGYTSILDGFFLFFFSFDGRYLWTKNVKSIHQWHTRRTISCNIAVSQTKVFHLSPNHAVNWQVWDIFISISNSIFHFSISCLGQDINYSLKVAKIWLGEIFKFSNILVWYLPLGATFC